MKTASELLRDTCSTVFSDAFPYENEKKLDAKQVSDQLFELQKLAVDLQRLVLDVRGDGATSDALSNHLFQVLR